MITVVLLDGAAAAGAPGGTGPLLVTHERSFLRTHEGGLVTNRGIFRHALGVPVELTVSHGQIEVQAPQAPFGFFVETELNTDIRHGGFLARLIDFDADGDLDIFQPLNQGGPRIVLNAGDGTFDGGFLLIGLEAAVNLRLADLDGDGDMDALAYDNGAVNVSLNNGKDEFTFHQAIPAAGQVQGILLGDLEPDGDIDVVLARRGRDGGHSIHYFQAGRFVEASRRLTEASDSRETVLGDLDGDGDLDIFTGPPDNIAWLNDPGGFRAVPTGIPPLNVVQTRAIATGDVDGDGDLDLFIRSASHPELSWLNDGNAGFTAGPRSDCIGIGNVQVFDLIDLDLDGDLDAVFEDSISFNDGHGGFGPVERFLPFYRTIGDVGDINGDGSPDVITRITDDPPVWLNRPPATVWSWTYEPPQGPAFETVELLARPEAGSAVAVQWSVSTENVQPVVLAAVDVHSSEPAVTVPLGGFLDPGDDGPWNVLVDWGDGSDDFFLAANAGDLGSRFHEFPAHGQYEVSVIVTESSGKAGGSDSLILTVGDRPVALSGGSGPTLRVDEGDLAARSWGLLADASRVTGVRANIGEVGLVELAAPGLGFVPTGQNPPGLRTDTLADLDGDGDLDALLGQGQVWLNDGDGQFALGARQLTGGAGPALGDLDGDGDVDAAFVIDARTVHVLLNDGNARFVETFVRPVADYPDEITRVGSPILGDLNVDGYLDVLLAIDDHSGDDDPWGNNVPSLAYLNDGSGNLCGVRSVGRARFLTLGDLDGDGDSDVIAALDSNDRVSLNDGTGTLQSQQSMAELFVHSRDIALGDLDGDGDLDAFLANQEHVDPFGRVTPGTDAVLVNRGDATFFRTKQPFRNETTTAVELGDLDGDGDLDAWLVSSPSTVWYNDGAGRFEDSGGRLPHGTVALGDLDGDGRLDAFASEVYLNRPVDRVLRWTMPTQDGPAESTTVTITALEGDAVLAAFDLDLEVVNTPPTFKLHPVGTTPCGQSVSLTVSELDDPSPQDRRRGFETLFTITTPERSDPIRIRLQPARQRLATMTATLPGSLLTVPGTWTVTASVTDKDGGTTSVTESFFVACPVSEGVKSRQTTPAPLER